MNVCPVTSLWDSTSWNAAGTLCSRTWQRQYMKFILSLWKLLPKWYIPFPGGSTKFQLMPPPSVFQPSLQLDSTRWTRWTDPPNTETRMFNCHHNNTSCDNSQIVPRGDTVTHLLHLDPPHTDAEKEKKLYQTGEKKSPKLSWRKRKTLLTWKEKYTNYTVLDHHPPPPPKGKNIDLSG